MPSNTRKTKLIRKRKKVANKNNRKVDQERMKTNLAILNQAAEDR